MRKLLPVAALLLLLLLPGCFSVPTIVTFEVVPNAIMEGESATLTWDVTGASSVSIDPLGVVDPAGAQSVSPATTTAYTLNASGFSGTVSKSVVLRVIPQPITVDFKANTYTIMSGQTANLTWNVTGVSTVLINQGVGQKPALGSTTVSPQTTTTYTLTANNQNSTGTASVTIIVNQPINVTFTANPTATFSGQGTMLTWDASGATSVSIDNGVGEVSVSGSKGVIPYTTTTYTLTATSPCCSVTKSLTVIVSNYSTFPSYWYPYWWFH